MVRVDSILRFGSVAESRARSLGRSEIPVLQQGCTRATSKTATAQAGSSFERDCRRHGDVCRASDRSKKR
jgi:hypothetical protein